MDISKIWSLLTKTKMKNNGHISIQVEAERIKALKKYDILDTPPDGSFDQFTKLAAKLLDVPIALISLVDTDRIWFKFVKAVGGFSPYGNDCKVY